MRVGTTTEELAGTVSGQVPCLVGEGTQNSVWTIRSGQSKRTAFR